MTKSKKITLCIAVVLILALLVVVFTTRDKGGVFSSNAEVNCPECEGNQVVECSECNG